MDRSIEQQLLGKQFGASFLVQVLGSGNLGTVYRAQYQNQLPALTTIFLLPHALSPFTQQRFMARFLQKGAELTKLHHDHILPIYEFGEQTGLCSMTTAFPKGQTLAQLLQQKGTFSPEEALKIVKQVASALDYAHAQGIPHGSLNANTIFVSDEQVIQIVGFGMTEILASRGVEDTHAPYAHLFSIEHTFLGNPEYFSPEYVQGAPIDTPTDIYALGILLFELLSGTRPLRGKSPLETALQQVECQIPLLQHVSPNVSTGFDFVVHQALEKRPEQRPRSAGAFVRSFERAVSLIQKTAETAFVTTPVSRGKQDLTLPPTMNWFSTQDLLPPPNVGTEKESENSDHQNASFFDPFLSLSQTAEQQARPTSMQKQTSQGYAKVSQRRSTFSKGRRHTLALLSIGTIAMLGSTGLSLGTSYVLTRLQKKASPEPTTPSSTMHMGNPTQETMGNMQSPPTRMPQPTPTSPLPTGVRIGSTRQQTKSVTSFTNPSDNQESFLVHLSNGNFVAYEKACTHEGVPVYYDPGTQQLVCPRHHAIFDPANGARVVQGPAPRPLSSVPIRINTDGTVTTTG